MKQSLISLVFVLLPIVNTLGQNILPEYAFNDSQTYTTINNDIKHKYSFKELNKNLKVKLDSTVFIWFNNLVQNDSSSTKMTYEYDIKGNITLEMSFQWDTLNTHWINVSKTENFYNENGLDTLNLYYDWDITINNWVNNRKIRSIYDAGNRLSSKKEFALIKGSWYDGEEVHYYDAYGNDTCIIGVYPYEKVESKTVCTYDVYGNMLTQIRQNHYPPHWVNSQKHQFAYNIFGDQTLSEEFKWNGYTNQWINQDKNVTYFDADRNDTCDIGYHAWDTVNNIWTDIHKGVSSYDSLMNRTSWTYSRWDYDHWFTPGKIEYFYDERNNEILSKWYAYDPIVDWISDVKYESAFDLNDNIISHIGYKWSLDHWLYRDKTYNYYFYKTDPIIFWNKPGDIVYGTLLSEMQLNATSNISGSFTYTPGIGTKLDVSNDQTLSVDFLPNDLTLYNSASKSVTINVIVGLEADKIQNNNQLKIYPNPVENELYIEHSNNQPIILQMTDITGRLVMSKQLGNNDFIDVSSLARGLYFISFESGDKIQTFKVVIK